MQGVDLSHAQLYGADFTYANLSNSVLSASFLTHGGGSQTAAKFDGAHLRNVDLSNAKLAGTSFRYASFYSGASGLSPTFPCPLPAPTSPPGCASAAGADLTNVDFSNAYLAGLDFGNPNTTVNGTIFNGAILIGANFAAVNFSISGGKPPVFEQAMLQGAWFDAGAPLAGASFLNAFLDFETLQVPAAAMSDADAMVRARAQPISGQGTRPGLLDTPVAAAVSATGVILVLESGNNRIQALDLGGNPVRYFNRQAAGVSPYSLVLVATTPAGGWTYLDTAVEFTGFIYVLSSGPVAADGTTPHRLDIYDPDQADGRPIATTLGSTPRGWPSTCGGTSMRSTTRC